MTDSSASIASPSSAVPIAMARRRLRVWARRAVWIVPALLAAVYAALPWIVPGGWLARRVAADMTRQAGRTVTIESMSLSWYDGVRIEGLEIEELAGPGRPPRLLSVGEIRCGLTPLRTLFTGQVDRLRMERVRLWLSLLPDGRLNIDDLKMSLPSHQFEYRDVTVNMALPDVPAQAHMDHVDVRLDRGLGELHLSGDATLRTGPAVGGAGQGTSPGRFLLQAVLNVPRLKQGVELAGGGELRWAGVDLSALPLHRFPALGLARLAGRTDGRIHLEALPDLGVEYEIEAGASWLAFRREGEPDAFEWNDAHLAAAGHWDPAGDRVVVRTLRCALPGLNVSDAGQADRPALIVDQRSEERVRVDVVGEVQDLAAVRRDMPSLEPWAKRVGVRASGPASFSLQASLGTRANHARVTLDAAGAALAWADVVDLPAGVAKQVVADASYDARSGHATLHRANLDVGDLHVAAEAAVDAWPIAAPRGAVDALRLAAGPTATAWFVAKDAALLDAYVPGLRRWCPGWRASGPVETSISLTRSEQGSTVEWRASAPSNTELRVGDWFAKPSGVSASARAAASWSVREPGRIRGVQVECSVGSGRLRVDGATIDLHEAVASGALQLDGRAHMWLSELSQWLAASPRLATALASLSPEPVSLRGDIHLALNGTGTVGAGGRSVRAAIDAELANAELRIPGVVEKPAHDPASLRVEYEAADSPERVTTRLVSRGELPGVVADVSANFEHPASTIRDEVDGRRASVGTPNQDARRAVRLDVRLADAERALAVWPALSKRLAAWDIAGVARFSTELEQNGATRSVSITADASGLQWTVPGESPLHKDAGVPCRVQGRVVSRDAAAATWTAEPGAARFAACEATWDHGEAALSAAWSAWMRQVLADGRWMPPPDDPLLAEWSASGRCRGEVNEALGQLSPAVAAWVSRLDLAGGAEAQWNVRVGPSGSRLAATIDATDARLRLRHVGEADVVKPIGTPATVAVDVERTPGADAAAAPRVTVHRGRVTLGDNHVDVHGEWTPPAVGGPLAPRDGRWVVEARLDRVDQVQALLGGHAGPPARGRVAADVQLDATNGVWKLGPSSVVLEGLSAYADEAPLQADGRVEFAQDRVLLDALHLQAGATNLTISGLLGLDPEHPSAQVGVHAEHVDVDELHRVRAALVPCVAAFAALGARAGPTTRPSATSGDAIDSWLRRADLDVQSQIDRLALTIPELAIRADLPGTVVQAQGRAGTIEMPWRVAAAGGMIDGHITFNLNAAAPYFDLAYTADRLQPGPLVHAYMKRSFPGFVATGPLALVDRSLQRLSAPSDEPNYPVGSGELVIQGGYVRGKAAPDWLARVFPGLNLARFDFVRMHDWFTKHADGRIDHRMIFQGPYYHVYMEGYTDANRNVRYEVGVDLLARLDSKYWVESRQGRIPLFVKTGRLADDGTLDPDVVTYLPMYRVIESLLVQNNVAITIYHAIRRQIVSSK